MTDSTQSSVVVHSPGEFITRLADLAASSNMKYWYRGQSDVTWHLEPNIFRGQQSTEEKKSRERDYMHTFRSRAGIRYERSPAPHACWIGLALLLLQRTSL